jgi:hypothetical protein
MNKKTKDTLNELIRRERINEYHNPITDMDIKDMIKDIKRIDKLRLVWKLCYIVLALIYIFFT